MGGDEDLRRVALDHAWRWFEYHAQQRLTVIKYYLIVFGAVSTAYFTAIKQFPQAAPVAAIVGVCASLLFYCLDSRVSDLIKCGEDSLREQEELLASDGNFDHARIVQASDKKRSMLLNSYRRGFAFLFWTTGLAFFGAAVYSIVQLCNSRVSN